MTPKPAKNHVFLIMEALQDKTAGGVFIPSWLEKEKYATVGAVLHSMGPNVELSTPSGHIVKPGDEVAVSYHAVFNYTTGKDGSVNYHDEYLIEGKRLWNSAKGNVIGCKVGDKWEAVTGYVIMEPVYEQGSAWLPDDMQKIELRGEGKLVSGNVRYDDVIEIVATVPADSICIFNPSYRVEYTFPDGKTYIVMREDQIVGVRLWGEDVTIQWE